MYWVNAAEHSMVGKMVKIADAQQNVNGRQTFMKNQLNVKEKRYLTRIKAMPCGVCNAAPPSDAHHIQQHQQYLCIPLCKDCHQGSFNGIHGQKRLWNVLKKTELTVLNDTIDKLQNDAD